MAEIQPAPIDHQLKAAIKHLSSMNQQQQLEVDVLVGLCRRVLC